MNCVGFYILLMLGSGLHIVAAECGVQELRENIGLLDYHQFGTNSTEHCRYTFNIPPDENSMLILDIKDFRAFRQGTPNKAYLVLPDGTMVHHLNRQLRVGNCYRYSRKNFQTNPCLEELADKYCSNPTTEVEQWPPILSSSALSSFKQSNGEFAYDMDFTFFYMYVSCPKAKLSKSLSANRNKTRNQEANNFSNNFFVSTIALSVVLVVVSIATTVTLVLLLSKSRKEKEALKIDLEQNSPPNNNLNENGQEIEEDIYENPNYTFATESPVDVARNSAYSHIDLDANLQQRPRSDNYNNICPPPPNVIPHQNEVVQNVLYHNM